MANETYHAGSDGKVYVTPPGGSTAIELDINRWNMRIASNNKDVSGSKVGRKRIKGLPDASGSLSAHFDTNTANRQTSTTALTGPSLRAGTIILLELSPEGAASGGTTSWRASAIIDNVEQTSEFEGTEDFNVDWSLADGSTLKYPGDT